MRAVLAIALSLGVLASASEVKAQSCHRNSPAPLQAGVNRGHVDGFVGPHYWLCNAGPGTVHFHVIFKSGGLFGTPLGCAVNVSIQDPNDKWITTKTLNSSDKPAECSLDGTLKKPMKVLITIAPPPNPLIRQGGDYEIEGSSAVTYLPASTAEPVLGMYKQMGGFTTDMGNAKFNADGTISTISGTNGKWKLFDAESRTYVIEMEGQKRCSGQLTPGFGIGEGGGLIYQCVP